MIDLNSEILKSISPTDLQHPIVAEAIKWIGHPSKKHSKKECAQNRFEHGMDPEEGFDCSAFVRYVLLTAQLPSVFNFSNELRNIRHCNEFFDTFGVYRHYEERRAGDLIVFTRDGLTPTHIGIVIDQDHFIHAPGKNHTRIQIAKIELTKLSPSSKERNYSYNPIGFKRPAIQKGRWRIPYLPESL